MTKAQIETAALELPEEERQSLAMVLLASLSVEPELPPEEVALLRARREEARRYPGLGQSWEEVEAELWPSNL